MKKHRLFAVLLALVMTLSLLPTAALAAGTTEKTDSSEASVSHEGNTVYYDSLTDAVDNAVSGDTVTLLKNVNLGSETLVLDKAITIDGGAEKFGISSTAQNVIQVLPAGGTLIGKIELDNLTIQATKSGKTGRAIGVGNSAGITGLNLTLDGCVLETTQRGITFYPDHNSGIHLTVKDSTISLMNGIADYDREVNSTDNFGNSRGISLWQMGDSEVEIQDSTIQGFYYSINNTGGMEDSMTVTCTGSTFKGRDAVNAHAAGTIWNLTDCNIHGINNFSGTQESFACIVLDSASSNNTVKINDCAFTTYFNEVGMANESAKQYMVAVRGTGNTVTVDEDVTGTTYTVVSDEKGGIDEKGKTDAVTIYGGTFSTDPAAYVASGYHAAQSGGSYTVHALNVTPVAAEAPACTEAGHNAYYACSGIGCEDVYYTDANCTDKYTLDQVVLAALGHAMKTEWSKDEAQHWHECSRTGCAEKTDIAAHDFVKTAAADGQYTFTCSVCGYTKTGTAADHTVTTSAVTNGTVAASPNPAKVGDTVTFTLTPDNGYGEAQLYVDGEPLSGTIFTMPDADVTVTGTFIPVTYTITYHLNGGTNSTANPTSYTVEQGFTLAAPTKNGYTFIGWSFNQNTDIIEDVTVQTGSVGDIVFTANWSRDDDDRDDDGGSAGGGSSSSSNTTTTTEKNDDGSTTTTTTDQTTGTVTETTKTADGTTGTVVTDGSGEITEVKSTVSATAAKEAAKTGEAVTLPVEVPAAASTGDAPAVQVTVPKSAGSVKVEIPVEKVTPGTVAVIVKADGTEEIVAASVVTGNGVALTLDGSATVKVIDNSKDFADVPETNVFYNEISSLSAREIMVGKTEDTFDLYNSVTLNQIANVAGRITGEVDVKDFNAGIVWGVENGLKTGDEAATRGEVLKALYVAAGSPAVEDTGILSIFNDSADIPADMAAIAAWAARNGILKGTVDGKADLNVTVTRGQACALAGRAMNALA